MNSLLIAEMKYSLPDINASNAFARKLSAYFRADDIIGLNGELGAGKTTFVRALVDALNGDVTTVSSPTYTLLNCYHASIPVIHIDAYRLHSEADLEGLGFSELCEGAIACIEWADRIGAGIIGDGKRYWGITLSHTIDGGREALVRPPIGRNVESGDIDEG
ncbi:MAG: tRNA (adenosine(37)-N6)-threonylcarbamoyltransferase complex ATPase subunit type 1 TsaE [Planctomycetes bacterium]|nr:tRNA (adenosine(37)-N6)-threonylcarbamoyltransferase complex ATPase subunit type 1 TsaE [Planctomycetota bacterium]